MGTTQYEQYDVSGSTDRRNCFDRGINPIGALIHTTSGVDSLSWLQRGSAQAGKPASADYLISRDGTRYKITPTGLAAYHAGIGSMRFSGHVYSGDDVSRRLIGIELENLDTEYCTFQQIDSLAELFVHLSVAFSWRWPYYILGHYETAWPLGRRSDPQGFAWGDFMGRLYERSRDANVPGLGSV